MDDVDKDWWDRCELLKRARVELDGHFGMDGAPGRWLSSDGRPRRESFVEFVRKNTQAPRYFRRGLPRRPEVYLSHEIDTCSECGAKLHATFDGEAIRVSSAVGPCPCPDGMPEYSFEVLIPSGMMVFTDDLRDFYPHVELGDISNNLGMRDMSMRCAAVNMGHGFVGNTCPGIYRISNSRIEIGNDGGHPDGDPHEGEVLGFVKTELWWYAIGDLQEISLRGFEREGYDVLVEVTPGRYRITHRWHTIDKNDSAPQTYAVIEHLGP